MQDFMKGLFKFLIVLNIFLLGLSFTAKPASATWLDPFVRWFRNQDNRENLHQEAVAPLYVSDEIREEDQGIRQPPQVPEFGTITAVATTVTSLGFFFSWKRRNRTDTK